MRENARISLHGFSTYPPQPRDSETTEHRLAAQQATDAEDCIFSQNCIFIDEIAYIVDLNRVYPEEPEPNARVRQNRLPDVCVLVATSYTKMVASNVSQLAGTTTAADFDEFLGKVLATIQEQPKHYLFFPLCWKFVADRFAIQVEAAGYCAIFLPREQLWKNPASSALDRLELLLSRRSLDQTKFETIDGRIKANLSKLKEADFARFVELTFGMSE